MPLEGEYVPSPSQWVREQVETYERTGGREANTLRDTGLPIIVVTTRGNKSGKLRKFALSDFTIEIDDDLPSIVADRHLEHFRSDLLGPAQQQLFT